VQVQATHVFPSVLSNRKHIAHLLLAPTFSKCCTIWCGYTFLLYQFQECCIGFGV
jgi:hypothetical protein